MKEAQSEGSDSLVAFVAAQQIKTACLTCNLPPALLEEISKARQSNPRKFQYTVISTWLRTKGHEVSGKSLGYHFRGHAR